MDPVHMRKILVFILVFVGGLLVIVAFTGSNTPTTITSPASDSTQSSSVSSDGGSSSRAPRDRGDITDDGTYIVGTDIKPGTYRVTVPEDSIDCYYARLKGTSGQLGDIITNDNLSPGAHGIVTIKATDAAFETRGCGAWRRR